MVLRVADHMACLLRIVVSRPSESIDLGPIEIKKLPLRTNVVATAVVVYIHQRFTLQRLIPDQPLPAALLPG